MVEVFKTNVENSELADQLASALHDRFPFFKINFDMDDCDRILRVEGNQINSEKIIEVISAVGFECKILES
ncbi:MAG: hypothetical protein HY015_07550 [Bacteroidetes bacterium]|nr:hypothetical protein [Bacteroidota bacterium]MBI3482814.1 hypothetical protein [Bacteroidota bacterium]